MSLATYWVEYNLSPLLALPGFDVVVDSDLNELAVLNRISQSEGFTHLKDGHLHNISFPVADNFMDPIAHIFS